MPDPFSRIARWYDALARIPDPAPLQRLLDLQAGQRLLDLGGGTGRMTQHLSGVKVIVCDLSAGMARQSHRKGLPTCQGRAEALPFGGAAFDAVLVVDAFHHFRDHREAAQEMLRVVRPEGRLVLVEPDIRRPFIRLVALGERLLGMDSRFFPLDEMRAMLGAAGGAVVSVEEERLSVRLVVRESSPPTR
jgi:demethylmenaquinone methyltransferase/2-methoxy-6-polyprenyl-1,4-benzoquinol methylase